MVVPSLNKQTARSGIQMAEWLTVERAAYAGITVLALGLRLYGLGRTSLGPAEAAQALPAWAATAGQPYDLAGVSPLLFALQRLLFLLFGASDFAARFWPALLGGLAPLPFYALRDRLSRGGALVAAFLWAISAVAVFTARLGLGDSLVAPLALALLAALSVWARRTGPTGKGEASSPAPTGATTEGSPLLWAAVALGLLLISGPAAYTVLLAGLVAALWWRGALPALWADVKAHRREVIIGLFAPLVLGATCFLLVPAGLAAAGDLVGAWLQGLIPGAGDYSVWDLLSRLLLSEPLLVGFGIAGLIWAWRRRDRFGLWAGMAAGLALLVPLIGRGRHPADLALVVLALTFLAGPAIARVLRVIPSWRDQPDPWLLIALSVALLISAAICLPSAWSPANNAGWRQLYTGVGIATAVLAVLAWVVYGVFGSWRTVAQALPIVPLVFGLAWGVGQLVSLSYDRGAGRQAAALIETPVADVADFAAELRSLSALNKGGASEAPVDLVWPARPGDPMLATLRWLLRDFPALRVSGSVPVVPAPIVITPAEDQPLLKDRYSGAEFAVLQQWRPRDLGDFNAYLRWVLYREAKTAPEARKVILWVDRTQK
jgi:4-amino-4-deoxy-L-arabinose transferase-like glycosyltransferase